MAYEKVLEDMREQVRQTVDSVFSKPKPKKSKWARYEGKKGVRATLVDKDFHPVTFEIHNSVTLFDCHNGEMRDLQVWEFATEEEASAKLKEVHASIPWKDLLP
jgi:hypothetical protein